ncbi:MAG: pilus assembly protein [Alphaproteobacteria bacterium]|nr:pilus assembly protein [Alphaproteobacteria bacterium]
MNPISALFRAGRGRRFLRDRRGLAAIEFALIAPVMILIYLGGFELTQGIALKRMVALTASTVTNLVAQYTTISASTQMPDILNASSQVLAPYPSSKAIVTISCITIDSNGKATVAWSQSLHGTPRTTGEVMSLPAALDVPNTTILYGEASYDYTPVIDFLHHGDFTLASSIYMYPRASSTVNLVN